MRLDSSSVVVVTGGADGIGKAVCKELLKLGCSVVLADIREDKLREAQLQLQRELPSAQAESHVLTFVVDVANKTQMRALREYVQEKCGGCCMVCACAGVYGGGPLETCEYKDFERVMDINFWGTVTLVKEFLPLLQKQTSAHIVVVSSLDGLIGMPGALMYCSSKFALTGFARGLQMDLAILAPHITVSNVHPGFVSTSIIANNKGFFDPDGLVKDPAHKGRLSVETISNVFTMMGSTTPDAAAQQIVNGVLSNRTRILVGNDAVILDVLSRIAPSVFHHKWVFPPILFVVVVLVRFIGRKMLLMAACYWVYKRWMRLEKGMLVSPGKKG